MEPLVIFGACLVVYCGYRAAADVVRDWRVMRLASRTDRRCRQKLAARRSRNQAHLQQDVLGGKPLLQRA